jgi:hypothetical protein
MKKCLSALIALLIVAVVAHAERPPQAPEKAQLVVSGTVTKLTTATTTFAGDGVRTDYTAEVVVDAVDKGDTVKAGDTITLTWFCVTTRPSDRRIVGAFGHDYSIKEKDKAKFWLMERGPMVPKGVWVVIYNKNGVEKIDK